MKHTELIKKNRKELEEILKQLEASLYDMPQTNGTGLIDIKADIEKVKYVLGMKNVRRGR